MSKIKVGQIWRGKTKKDTIVITHIRKCGKRSQELWDFDYIWKDGETFENDEYSFIVFGRKLIAEYPTWQEAVNSKEFNNETI